MSAALRLFLSAGAVTIAFIGLGFAQPGWLQDLQPELPRLPESRSGVSAEDELPEELRQRCQILVARLQIKLRVVDDLCAERLTLLEAAVRFRELDRLLPTNLPDQFRLRFPGASEEECYCLKVIAATEAQMAAKCRQGTAIVTRLRAELQERLAYGNLILPDRE